MLMGIASFAQKKGDMYVSGSELYASKLHTSTWGGYINILEFEFKVSEKFSIGANAGGLGCIQPTMLILQMKSIG